MILFMANILYYTQPTWTMIQMPTEYETLISVVHFPGKSKSENIEFMDYVCNSKVFIQDIPEEHKYTIATLVTENVRYNSPLIYQLNRNEIPYVNLGEGVSCENWTRLTKPKIIREHLDQIKTQYTLLLDGLDTAIAGQLIDFVPELVRRGFDILCNATLSRFPDVEVEVIENRFEKFGWWQYLNAGVMFGKTEAIKKLYDYIIETSESDPEPVDSEQYYVRKYWSENPDKIGMDYERRVFAIINKDMFKETDWKTCIK